MFFTTNAVNSILTIADESSYVASAAAINDFSNDKDYFEVDDTKTNKNDKSSVKDPINVFNDGNYIQLIIT